MFVAVLNVVLVVIAFRVAWSAANRRVAGVSELNDQLQGLLGATSLLTTSVLGWITWYYAVTTRGLLAEAQSDRAGREFQQLAEQAGMLGGHVDRSRVGSGDDLFTATLHNVSKLPVRAVRAWLDARDGSGRIADFQEVPVMPPGRHPLTARLPAQTGHVILRFEFDDDNGRTWMKYGVDAPLLLVRDPYKTDTRDV